MRRLHSPNKKPNGRLELNPNAPLADAMRFALVPTSHHPYTDLVTGEIPAVVQGAVGPSGIRMRGGDLVFYGGSSGNGPGLTSLRYRATSAGDVTLVTRFYAGDGGGSYPRLIDLKNSFNGADGWYFIPRRPNENQFHIRGGGGTAVTQSSTYGLGRTERLAVGVRYDGTTVYIHREGEGLLGSGTIGAITSVEQAITVGHNTGNNEYAWYGGLEYLYLFAGAIDAKQVDWALSNPYAYVRPALRRVYSIPPAAGVAVSPNDIAQVQTLDAPTITQDHQLAPNDIAQVQTLDAPTITQDHQLAPNDIAQVQTLDAPTVTTGATATPNDIAQVQSLDAVTLVVDGIISPNDIAQIAQLEGVLLVQTHTLAINNIAQAQLFGAPSIVFPATAIPAGRALVVTAAARAAKVAAAIRTMKVSKQ